jgi:predicted  nucleic acid-binding Zn-ribbon protein
MPRSAEFRTALAQLESMAPTLTRILKAAQAGAAILDTLEEQQLTLERNIAGLKEREERSLAATQAAKDESIRVTRDTEVCVIAEQQRATEATATVQAIEKRLATLKTEAAEAQRHLTELRTVIEEHERRAAKAAERADRMAAALSEAAKS